MEMDYRRLGGSGLQLSVLSLGSWVTFGPQLGVERAAECMSIAREAGVNFFDNAESYAGGESERIMGRALAELAWPRHSYLVSTKLFWGLSNEPNMRHTLNRKYLLQGIDGSLERLGLDFVDLIFCHRPDPSTPVTETVWAMHDIVSAGKALYWGTSEWPAEAIVEAHEIAERHHLRAPVMEQPEYNLLSRKRVEGEYESLVGSYGLGLTTWSPLASGQLTGKYLDGVPDRSRGALGGYEWLSEAFGDEVRNKKVRALKEVAESLGCSLAQLSLAWCVRNPSVSSVITGASKPEQVRENMASLEVVSRLDADVLARIDEVTA